LPKKKIANLIFSMENILQEKMKELRRLRTRYQPGKENAYTKQTQN